MSATPDSRPGPTPLVPRGIIARARTVLPHGGSLPDEDWRQRHGLIVWLLRALTVVVAGYAVLAHGPHAISYIPEVVSMLAFAALASWDGTSHKWRAVSASMGLLTGSAALVDISGGLLDMHFSFFIVIVVLTLYEDWVPFLLAVGFVLIHHGVMGMIDPRAVFDDPRYWHDPWAWAALHALFMALAGVAGVTAWGLNERVRDRMRDAQRELERLGLTDPLTGLGNRRRLMADLDRVIGLGDSVALAIFDLDGFKEYNDRFGHPAGDALLTGLTESLRAAVTGRGQGYRLGGDEFCVLSEPLGTYDVDALLERWTSCFAQRGDGFSITASSGAAVIPAEAADASEALRLCDLRMYSVKHTRRATAAVQTKDVLLAALATCHEDLGGHLSAVAAAAEEIGADLGLTGIRVQELSFAAELHDIGKIAVPHSIISKPGALDEREWRFMQRHTLIGERILMAAPATASAAHIVRATHERYDGTGYPDRIAGAAIPLEARIICVCDAYYAMTSDRPYRRPRTREQALAELQRCAGGQFDPLVVDAFLRRYADAPPPGQAGRAPVAPAETAMAGAAASAV
jgi:diguanylate cyclase (GGDEF)-like protein